MRRATILGGFFLTLIVTSSLCADDTVINTPVTASQLRGVWELQPSEDTAFKQLLSLGGSVEGSWLRSRETKPMTLAWFVEGKDLRILHYYEPDKPFNYRVKTLTFRYEVDGDSLTLANDEEKLVWKRIKRLPPPRL
jgi:hypothetical protein